MSDARPRTRGEREAEFTRAMIQLEKDYLGRGPEDVRTVFVLDMVVVRLRGILTRAEIKLCETPEGSTLVKETRRRLFESARDIIAEMVSSITGAKMVSLHTDMSTRTGERVVVITVEGSLDS
ncbi:MAG: DUF2294 domain-containing protein [Anaerolineae bacterium]|jgi:uncharacterized protein YbcI|nr:DUF2294 domain-containing protein [Anaerolineae bacterium]